MEQKLTLSELNEQIRKVIEGNFPVPVWVIAEISELKEKRNGHCYLELVEKKGAEIVARARATIWSYTYRMLKPYFETTTGQFLTHGIKILVQVSVEFHPAFGLSLNIKDIDPAYTIGDMAMQRMEIINRLQAEGIFEMNRELELPLAPQKIAIISSATAAGYLDFMDHLENNERGFKFYTKLFHATMQGTETAPSIIAALGRIFRYEDFFDAVIIIRGGGATADLSSFDNYDLALNITQFPLPVITGIGHEKDDTIIDLVAHTRLKTPTAVAEFFINGIEKFYKYMLEKESEIVQLSKELTNLRQNELENLAVKLNVAVNGFINRNQKLLTKKGNKLLQSVKHFSFRKERELSKLKHGTKSKVLFWSAFSSSKLALKQQKLKLAVNGPMLKQHNTLNHYKDLVLGGTGKLILREQDRIHLHENTTRLIHPENVLKRGYSITYKEGKIVKSTNQVQVNEEIETRFADGTVKSKIINNEENDK